MERYYGLYKQDIISTKKRLILGKNQYTERGTDGTSGTMGWGVAELHNEVQYVNTQERRNATYQRTNISIYPNLYYREGIDI